MKLNFSTFFIVPLSLISLPLSAHPISELNTFDAGSPVIAAEMNGNFDSVKKAANDNDSRITSLESAKPATGPQGKTGPKGATGPAGVNGVDFLPVSANKGDILFWDGSDWKLTAAPSKSSTPMSLILVDGVPKWVAQSNGSRVYSIGDTGPAGGKVFYTTDGGAHGLEAAPSDQSSSTHWGCTDKNIPGADGTKIGTGGLNTGDIVANCSDAGTAAKVAANYWLNGFRDWYLPSQIELSMLYKNRNIVDQLGKGFYWTSTESFDKYAWYQGFSKGEQAYSLKDKKASVRAIRSF